LDKIVGVWDVANRRHVRDLHGHDDSVTSLVFCADGVTAFSGSRDGLIRRWSFDRPAQYAEFALSLPKARKALEDDPEDVKALILFGRWFAFRGVYDWAAEFLERSRAAGGDVPSLDLARCYWQLGRHEDAAREFRTASERHEAPAAYLELCLSAVTAPGSP
jgi:tetratricopeptide (TPR) repeat protein